MRKGHFFGSIPDDVRLCLKKSCGFALCTLGVGSLPVFAFRRLGWQSIKPLYTKYLFSNVYVGAMVVVGTILLAVFAVAFPIRQNKRLKYQLWLSTCLSVGTLIAPIVLTPKDILTIVSGYVIGLTVPTAIACAISPNFLFLNVFSFLSMVLSTLFMHTSAIPWIINRRHIASGTQIMIPLELTSSFILPFIVGCALIMMLHTNLFVWYVKKCHETQNEELSAGSSRKTFKKALITKIDGTDEVTNGMIIAGYVVYTFLRIWWQILKHLSKSTYKLLRTGRVHDALEDV
jgi:hypothetical protein